METIELATQIAAEAVETKAKDLKLLDLRNLVSFTDYFIIGTGTSDRHVRSIADRIHMKVKKDLGRLPLSYEGQESGNWVLLDYGDVVLHIFLEDQRGFYGLDEFWANAPQISIAGVPVTKPKKASTKQPEKKSVKKPSKKPSKKPEKKKAVRKPEPKKSNKPKPKPKAKTKAKPPLKKKKK